MKDANLPAIVEYAKDQFASDQKVEMQEMLMTAIADEQPVAEVTKMVKEKQAASKLTDIDTIQVLP